MLRDQTWLRSPTVSEIAVSTRVNNQGSAIRSCTHNTRGDNPPAEPTEGLELALPVPRALEIFALMTFANEGVNTSSLLRDLLRVDMVGDKGMAWCTSKPEQSLYDRVAG